MAKNKVIIDKDADVNKIDISGYKQVYISIGGISDIRHVEAGERIREQQINDTMMNKQIKVTALTDNGGAIVSGWFADVNKGEEYARELTARGYVVVKQYR